MTRIAVVGAGLMGAIHARSCAGIPDAEVTWVADQDVARADVLAAEVGAKATAEAAEAVAAPDVDAVVVALPTPGHRPLTELAAAHGKHVFCEKPIALTVEDARAMAAACRRAGVRLMVGHVVRFFPEYARIRELIAEGAIGRVGVARLARLNKHPRSLRPWYADLATSGGLVVDLMIHDLDILRWYFGEVERVFAHGLTYVPGATTDHALAVLRFANGVIAHVQASWAHAGFRTVIEVAGEHGILRHDSERSAPLRLERTDAGAGEVGTLPHVPPTESPYQTELRHFVARLRDGAPFLVEGEDAVRALELALAVHESIRTGRPVGLACERGAREVA